MSSYTIPTLKSPKSSNPETKKLPTSPKTPKLTVKIDQNHINNTNDNSQVTKLSRIETPKARIEIKTSPNNAGRISLHKSRSPPNSLKNDDQVSRLGIIKEYLSPTSQAEKSSLKTNKEKIKPQFETQADEPIKENPIRITSKATGSENSLSVKKSPQRITLKPEPATPGENKLHKRLASGVPTYSKLTENDEERPLAKACSTARLDGDKVELQKDKKKIKNELVTRNNPKITLQTRKGGEYVPSLVLSSQGGTTQRLLSPQSQSAINRRLKNETPLNTGRHSVQSVSSPMSIKSRKELDEEVLQKDNLDVIKETINHNESRNGSCSPKNDLPEKKTQKNKKLNLVIPTVQISTDELSEVKQNSKPLVSTTRGMFYNADVSRDESQQPNQGNKSARLIKSLANASVDNKIDEKDLDQLSLFPSRNSDFSFPMKYFKPIEDSMLDQFIQTVNDSQKGKNDNENVCDSSKLSHESKLSPLKSDKSVKELHRSRISTPALLGSPSMTNLSTKEKPFGNNTPQARHLSPPSALKTSARPRDSGVKVKAQKDEQLKRNFSPIVDTKVRMRSPPKKWEQVIPKSPPRTQSRISNNIVRNSIDSKDGSSFIRTSFSRLYPKLAEEMESVPVDLLNYKLRGNKSNNNQSDNKFSNLDKLLAQLRNNSKAKIEISLPETEDSEKGLFNQSAEPEGDESMNIESSINRSFARTFIKFNNNA